MNDVVYLGYSAFLFNYFLDALHSKTGFSCMVGGPLYTPYELGSNDFFSPSEQKSFYVIKSALDYFSLFPISDLHFCYKKYPFQCILLIN